MLIKNVRSIEVDDPSKYAWSEISRYKNVEFTSSWIDSVHSLGGSHRSNVKKQAKNIRHCLIQASQYREAAKLVDLSTRPLLMYYSCMSLALVQVLLKGSGDVSLDRARGKNAHHGFTLKGADRVVLGDFQQTASALLAAPLEHADGSRFGSFELWHESARPLPVGGKVITKINNGTTETFEDIAHSEDVRMDKVPASGISLLECYSCIPQMASFLEPRGIVPRIAKAHLKFRVDLLKKTHTFELVIQPTNLETRTEIYEDIKFKNYRSSVVDIHDYGNGCAIILNSSEFDGPDSVQIPEICQINTKEVFLYSKLKSLNEFGMYYVSLYILGNYARYFPDKWMEDVETNSDMALAAERLLSITDERIALLTLSELERRALVIKK